MGQPETRTFLLAVACFASQLPGDLGDLAEPGRPEGVESYFTAGDVAYQDEEGFLYIVDRIKDTILVGGANIYPAEIEQVLRSHPAVADAAVFGIPHDDLGEEIKAVVELIPAATVEPEELRAPWWADRERAI